jgi:hypothetical protein|tara:strand:- start:1602 stop:1886 length:285 start_codon:yes stop_codon:yes gene_type:complete
MLNFEAENIEELEQEARDRAIEVSVEVTTAVIKALESGADKVAIGVLTSLDMDLHVDKANYLEALETNLKRCELAEEYELCEKSIEWIEKLKNQ